MPKEMLPLIDRPVIQVIVEQAVAAGVTEIIIVTGTTKRAIEDHFDRSDKLEQNYAKKVRTTRLMRLSALLSLPILCMYAKRAALRVTPVQFLTPATLYC